MTKAALTIALLLGAHLNLTALVPAAPGQGSPPWWVGGGLFWPFFADTSTLLPAGGLRDTAHAAARDRGGHLPAHGRRRPPGMARAGIVVHARSSSPGPHAPSPCRSSGSPAGPCCRWP